MAIPNPLTPAQVASLLLSALDEGKETATLTVTSHPSPEMVGARILIAGGERVGSLQDPGVNAAAEELARVGLAGDPSVLTGVHDVRLQDGGACQALPRTSPSTT